MESPPIIVHHVSATKSFLHFGHFAEDAILCSNFIFLCPLPLIAGKTHRDHFVHCCCLLLLSVVKTD